MVDYIVLVETIFNYSNKTECRRFENGGAVFRAIFSVI